MVGAWMEATNQCVVLLCIVMSPFSFLLSLQGKMLSFPSFTSARGHFNFYPNMSFLL
jgi:hypothetical protein